MSFNVVVDLMTILAVIGCLSFVLLHVLMAAAIWIQTRIYEVMGIEDEPEVYIHREVIDAEEINQVYI